KPSGMGTCRLRRDLLFDVIGSTVRYPWTFRLPFHYFSS
ncbi:unnamed protein product, partial [Allacma fusca]